MGISPQELKKIKDEIGQIYIELLPVAQRTVRNKLFFFITDESTEYILNRPGKFGGRFI